MNTSFRISDIVLFTRFETSSLKTYIQLTEMNFKMK